MKKKFLLYLLDDEVILYQGTDEKTYIFKGNIEDAQRKLGLILSAASKIPLRLLIDISHLDIREEKLPFLFPWDRMRLLYYKRSEWAAQGGYGGAHFFKQEGVNYLRYVYVSPKDSLFLWLLWIQSLSNSYEGAYFIPLEAAGFLKQYLAESVDYHLLLYPLSSHKSRHIIVKRRRLLLFRLSHGEDDLKASLHFLSRSFPDIYEKLQGITLIEDTDLTLPNVTPLSDPQAFMSYLASRERPSIPLVLTPFSWVLWLKRGGVVMVICVLLLIGVKDYQGFCFKNKTGALLTEIKVLKTQEQALLSLTEHKDIPYLKAALKQYHFLSSHQDSPFKILEQLALLIKRHPIRFEHIRWTKGKEVEMTLTFLKKNEVGKRLFTQFNDLLESCSTLFPKSHIDVLEAPLNSSSHEVYKNTSKILRPQAHIKIVFP